MADTRPAVVAFVHGEAELLGQVKSHPDGAFAVADGARIRWRAEAPATLVVSGHAQVELEFDGPGRSMVHCFDDAKVRLTTRGRCEVQLHADQSCDLRTKTHGASRLDLHLTGHSRARVRTFDESRIYLETEDLASAWLEVHDRARPRWRDWPSDWEARTSDVYFGQELICFATPSEAESAARRLFDNWRRSRSRYLASLRVAGAVPKLCPNAVDFRWTEGTVHLELPGDVDTRAWLSRDAHDLQPLTEAQRLSCTRVYLD